MYINTEKKGLMVSLSPIAAGNYDSRGYGSSAGNIIEIPGIGFGAIWGGGVRLEPGKIYSGINLVKIPPRQSAIVPKDFILPDFSEINHVAIRISDNIRIGEGGAIGQKLLFYPQRNSKPVEPHFKFKSPQVKQVIEDAPKNLKPGEFYIEKGYSLYHFSPYSQVSSVEGQRYSSNTEEIPDSTKLPRLLMSMEYKQTEGDQDDITKMPSIRSWVISLADDSNENIDVTFESASSTEPVYILVHVGFKLPLVPMLTYGKRKESNATEYEIVHEPIRLPVNDDIGLLSPLNFNNGFI
jgi:hypothetical protein